MSLLSVKKLAKYLNLSERTVYKLVRENAIPTIKLGGTYRFDQEEIELWIKNKPRQQIKAPGTYDTKDPSDHEVLTKIKTQADPLTKRLIFVGLLTLKLKDKNVTPIIVGGNAIEFYTAGGYATGDIDIICPSGPLEPILKDLGLSKEGRHWYSDDLGIAIEAPAAFLDAGSKERITQVSINGLVVHIIGIEDLIVDRLNALVHWKSADDRNWAKELISLHQTEIDWPYLTSTAKSNKIHKALADIVEELGLKGEFLK